MKYTIKELLHLREVRALGLDNMFFDDENGTDRSFFEQNTDIFLYWLESMEKKGKIKELLSTMKNK